jgi:hypothetical protein
MGYGGYVMEQDDTLRYMQARDSMISVLVTEYARISDTATIHKHHCNHKVRGHDFLHLAPKLIHYLTIPKNN